MTDEDRKALIPLVNNPLVWNVLDTHLLKCYNNKQKESRNLTPIEEIYRAQGYLQAMQYLRDLKVNVNVT